MADKEFHVYYAEVQSLQNTYRSYSERIETSLLQVNQSAQELAALSSFTGAGGDAAKAYFQEVHLKLTACLTRLAEQLETDYADYYYPKFAELPVCETDGSAVWPSAGIERAEQKLLKLAEGELADAIEDLAAAKKAMPASVCFEPPSSEALAIALRDLAETTKKVRNGVTNIEVTASSAFSGSSSEFEELGSALAVVLKACQRGDVSVHSYTAGAFGAIVESSGLKRAFGRAGDAQAQKRDIVVASQKDSLEKEKVRVEESLKKQVASKEKAAKWGLFFSGVAVIGALGVVFTVGGTLPVIFAALSLLNSIDDSAARFTQLRKIEDGDYGADREGIFVEGSKGALGKAAHYTDDIRAICSTSGEGASGEIKRGFATGVVVDGAEYAVDSVAENIFGEKVGVYTDAVTDGVSEAVGQWMTFGSAGNFKFAGALSSIGSAGTAIADYYVDEADAQVDALVERGATLDSLGSNDRVVANYDYGTGW